MNKAQIKFIVTPEEYVGGIIDMTGEIVRYAI